jgi:hypothetical protein
MCRCRICKFLIKKFTYYISLIGIILSVISSKLVTKFYLSKVFNRALPMYFFFAGFFNFLYNNLFLLFFSISYEVFTKSLEKGYFELIGPFGFYKIFKFYSFFLREFSPSTIFFSICLYFFFINIIILFFF